MKKTSNRKKVFIINFITKSNKLTSCFIDGNKKEHNLIVAVFVFDKK